MKKKILVVDDEELIRKTISLTLIEVGYEVETAKSGKEAFEKVINAENKGKTIDLILTDTRVSYMSGIELINKLNREKFITPFILVSGNIDTINLLKSYELVCIAFIFTSFTP